ncbi:hypothetical protein ACOYW6_09025 [Parablastomonas sp. CN1-191]
MDRMPLRLEIAYGLIALLAAGAVALLVRVRRARKARDKNRRYLK